jgi:type IV pilus assembly protein PilA
MNAPAPVIVHDCDFLPASHAVAQLVKRIIWRLDANLLANRHKLLSSEERAALFSLADASAILDGIATLPGMALAEESARTRLLDLFEVFKPSGLDDTIDITDTNGATVTNIASRQRGFTLIELMIVVCIIGVLAAIAIPSYREYVTRSNVVEGLNLTGSVKVAVAESFADSGSIPVDLESLGATPPSGKYVEAITLTEGAILIHYGREAAAPLREEGHNVLALAIGTTESGQILWNCGRAPLPVTSEGVPIAWHADAAALTTIEAKFLPGSCRG